jgi:hypothetical protein
MEAKIFFMLLFSSIMYTEAQVGINTSSPDTSAALDIQAKPDKPAGFLPPRVNLTSHTDALTITSPATGLIVYNSNPNAANLREGISLNTGTPAAPLWQSLTPENGVEIGKLVYFGTTMNASKTLKKGGFEFKFTIEGAQTYLYARLIQAPTDPITISGNRVGWVSTITGLKLVSQTWNSTDWNTWKVMDFMANGASHFFYLRVSNSNQFYKISNFVNQNSFNSLIVEIY